ncbi:complex I subunit 1 family protein [Roseicyclus sp. F158]|uniref:Complex I subunit 1 family protein n=1 Tax=Tropicimonas omnivorans TaxID=3075590 RepID=A0ABU3DK30_9RHOB|nr:complex I subunit 1 family protein [Roseicyclus sp. F158]MDT0684085.1 complex I subunit 1 family protein [Roseicyclus sp. F158]
MTALLTLAVLATLLGGTLFAVALDRAYLPLLALFTRQRVETEAPDRLNRDLAPAWYLALAAIGIAVVPFAPDLALIDSPVGIVIWGSCEALIVVTVFLHGWSPNAPFPLIGAYRYAAIGLPVMLPSMFVLIAAALPAESLSLVAIVDSQREVWNVIRQPLGLPLFMVVALAMTLRGPMDYADAADIATGTSAEDSGAGRAVWQIARLAMLVSVSAIAATVFLGGPLGPVLPGPVWLWLKTGALMALTVWIGNRVARTTPSRMLTILWVVLLPLSFLHLLISGLIAL